MSKERVSLCTDSGEVVKAMAPIIISASRSTDIPAFYADWFLERLKAGYSVWVNPFNQARYRVSFADTRMIVFWSKNPRPMLERLDVVEALGFKQYYFQFTLNDYMAEGLEPNVPPVAERIDTFRRLARRIGKERVIWRFDPLLLSGSLTVDVLLEKIASIGHELQGATEKLVFSFADIQAYRKVGNNLSGTNCREFSSVEKMEFAKGLRDVVISLGLEMATCAEDIDLSEYARGR